MTVKKEVDTKAVKKPKKIDSNQDIELIKSLEDVGISQNEAIVYIYLLRRGVEVGGSKIALGTQIHRQYVYITLQKLMDLGLVIPIKIGSSNKYKAVSPTQIEKLARKKLDAAGDVAQRLSQISSLGHEQDFELILGGKGIKEYYLNYVKTALVGETRYFIGGSSKPFVDIMGDDLAEYLHAQEEKKFTTYVIADKKEGEAYKMYQDSRINFNTVFLNEMPESLPNMGIRDSVVELVSYFNPPILYVIRSKNVAEKYKEFFMMLWRTYEKKEGKK